MRCNLLGSIFIKYQLELDHMYERVRVRGVWGFGLLLVSRRKGR